jgi:hypothetical protein
MKLYKDKFNRDHIILTEQSGDYVFLLRQKDIDGGQWSVSVKGCPKKTIRWLLRALLPIEQEIEAEKQRRQKAREELHASCPEVYKRRTW